MIDVRPAELDSAFLLLARFYSEEGFATPADELRRNLASFMQDLSCWVATAWIEDRPVGIATASSVRSTEEGLLAEIQDLYVLPEARGRGAARALVAAGSEWARGRGCRSVEVVITPEAEALHGLSAFYASLGFDGTGRVIHARRLI